jgi:hypothetical protein
MELCATCRQPILENVQERRFISKVPPGVNTPPGTGRYLTILNLTCACGVRVVRRYENRPSRDVNLPEYQLR